MVIRFRKSAENTVEAPFAFNIIDILDAFIILLTKIHNKAFSN